MLDLVSLVLNVIFLVVLLFNWSSRSVTVYIVKVVLVVALLTVQILLGNLWLSLLWGFVLVLNAVSLVVFANDAIKTREGWQEPVEEDDDYYHCSHCATSSDTNRGNCKQCGAPLLSR